MTLKSPFSVPPYRVENKCKDVVVQLIPAPLIARRADSLYADYLGPGEWTPYAWDEPTLPNKLQVRVRAQALLGVLAAAACAEALPLLALSLEHFCCCRSKVAAPAS